MISLRNKVLILKIVQTVHEGICSRYVPRYGARLAMCGVHIDPWQASHAISDWLLCISMKLCRGSPPYHMTPRFWVELLQCPHRQVLSSCSWLLPLPVWEDWSFMAVCFFCHDLPTTPLLGSFSLSGSPCFRAHLFSRIHSFSARNQQEAFKTYITQSSCPPTPAPLST